MHTTLIQVFQSFQQELRDIAQRHYSVELNALSITGLNSWCDADTAQKLTDPTATLNAIDQERIEHYKINSIQALWNFTHLFEASLKPKETLANAVWALLSRNKVITGTNLCFMPDLPANSDTFDWTQYAKSYLWIANEKSLYYVGANLIRVRVTIQNNAWFDETSTRLNPEHYPSVYLSNAECSQLITNNGGHKPEDNTNGRLLYLGLQYLDPINRVPYIVDEGTYEASKALLNCINNMKKIENGRSIINHLAWLPRYLSWARTATFGKVYIPEVSINFDIMVGIIESRIQTWEKTHIQSLSSSVKLELQQPLDVADDNDDTDLQSKGTQCVEAITLKQRVDALQAMVNALSGSNFSVFSAKYSEKSVFDLITDMSPQDQESITQLYAQSTKSWGFFSANPDASIIPQLKEILARYLTPICKQYDVFIEEDRELLIGYEVNLIQINEQFQNAMAGLKTQYVTTLSINQNNLTELENNRSAIIQLSKDCASVLDPLREMSDAIYGNYQAIRSRLLYSPIVSAQTITPETTYSNLEDEQNELKQNIERLLIAYTTAQSRAMATIQTDLNAVPLNRALFNRAKTQLTQVNSWLQEDLISDKNAVKTLRERHQRLQNHPQLQLEVVREKYFGADTVSLGGLIKDYLTERHNTYYWYDYFSSIAAWMFGTYFVSDEDKRTRYMNDLHGKLTAYQEDRANATAHVALLDHLNYGITSPEFKPRAENDTHSMREYLKGLRTELTTVLGNNIPANTSDNRFRIYSPPNLSQSSNKDTTSLNSSLNETINSVV